MTLADWKTLIDIGFTLLGTIVVPWLILAYQKRTGVQVTAQQRAAISASLDTAKGIIETRIDQGKLTVADVRPEHSAIAEAAHDALARVPDAAAAQGISVATAATIIVGRVDTSLRRPAAP